MFLEKRKNGKYYLVYSYRTGGKVKKIRKYLGINLKKDNLNKRRIEAEKEITGIINLQKINLFNFMLSEKEVQIFDKFDNKIKIHHLNKKAWEIFTKTFVYNTNAIEGSKVAEGKVPEILKKAKVNIPDEIETKGVAKAVNFIRETKEDLSLKLMLKLHSLCFKGSKEFAGKFRDVEVVVANAFGEILHRGVAVEDLDKELKELIMWYKGNKNKFKPLVLAAILHNQFEHIHPFQDGNGRVGRLLLNFILIRNKYPPINILLEDNQEYYFTLRMYSKNHDLTTTLEFLVDQYRKTLKKVTTKKK